MTNIYVGNLSYKISSTQLEDTFAEFGEVASAKVVEDRESGQSKGFGFIEMPSAEDAENAIQSLNDQELDGRRLKVNVAREREESSRRW